MKHFLQNHLRLLILAIASIFLSACSPSDFRIGGCALGWESGVVRLKATDLKGQPLSGYRVSFQINNTYGKQVGETDCDTTEECTIGDDITGEWLLTVSKAGFETTTLNVTVTSNGCVPVGEKVTVVLKPLV